MPSSRAGGKAGPAAHAGELARDGWSPRTRDGDGTPAGDPGIGDALAFMVGYWRVARRIDDQHSGRTGTFQGHATCIRLDAPGAPARARYEERGVLRIGTHTGPSRRVLELVRIDGSALMRVFADGRPFLRMDLSLRPRGGVHHCGDDRYEITTRVLADGRIEERWQVTGPAKRYRALTTLERAAPAVRVPPPEGSAGAPARR